MSPIKAAVAEPRGNYLSHDDYVKGVIKVFLEKALVDDDFCLRLASGFAFQAARVALRYERDSDLRVARAALVTLMGEIK